MKKVLLYLSMLVFALSFTACSSDDDDEDGGGDSRVTGIWANVQSNGLVEGYYVVGKSTIEYYEFPINTISVAGQKYELPQGYYQDGYILCTGNGTKSGAFNYKLKGNELWIGDVMVSTVTFLDDETVYLEGLDLDNDADEATYKRIKGLKIDKDFFGE
jgi:hypothetical protein